MQERKNSTKPVFSYAFVTAVYWGYLRHDAAWDENAIDDHLHPSEGKIHMLIAVYVHICPLLFCALDLLLNNLRVAFRHLFGVLTLANVYAVANFAFWRYSGKPLYPGNEWDKQSNYEMLAGSYAFVVFIHFALWAFTKVRGSTLEETTESKKLKGD